MNCTINLAAVHSKQDFYALLEHTLPFSEYFGHNLDALYDVLTDMHEPVHITFMHCNVAHTHLNEYFTKIQQTFADATQNGSAVTAEWQYI